MPEKNEKTPSQGGEYIVDLVKRQGVPMIMFVFALGISYKGITGDLNIAAQAREANRIEFDEGQNNIKAQLKENKAEVKEDIGEVKTSLYEIQKEQTNFRIELNTIKEWKKYKDIEDARSRERERTRHDDGLN